MIRVLTWAAAGSVSPKPSNVSSAAASAAATTLSLTYPCSGARGSRNPSCRRKMDRMVVSAHAMPPQDYQLCSPGTGCFER